MIKNTTIILLVLFIIFVIVISLIFSKKITKTISLNSIFNDLIVNEFFDEETLHNFLYDIIKIHQELISKYIQEHNLKENDIIMVFTGGNMIKMSNNKLFYNMSDDIIERLHNADCLGEDFTIIVNPDIYATIPSINDDLAELSYNAQYRVREKIMNDPTKYLRFMKEPRIIQKDILNKYLLLINYDKISFDTIDSKGSYGSKYQKINDKMIIHNKTTLIKPKILNTLPSNPNMIYLEDNRFENKRYNIVKMSANFTIERGNEIKNIGGNLVCIRIGKYLENLYDNIDKNIQKYNIYIGNKILEFTSYSIEYLKLLSREI
jgi:hypothetical protein